MIPLKDDLPTERTPVLTYAIVAANVLAFVWQLQVGLDVSAFRGGAIPFEILKLQDIEYRDIVPPPFTILTSMFLHGGFVHLGFNMLTLWIFGNNVEDALGKVRFLVFYLLGGVAATTAQTVVTLYVGSEAAAEVPNLGASGAISAVLGAYLVLLPNASVVTVFFFFIFFFRELPAWLFLGAWFLLQLWAGGFSLVEPEAGGGIAFFAHLGGFLFGALAVRFFVKQRPLQPAY
ncbi:MAG TPA: rhomboid family intramembrane serine protease [Gaiellaceae bacterium]|nr:rhomboid family intramembrane serine protease [Gaiellaceae bacterium]